MRPASLEKGSLVHVVYRDLVKFARTDPELIEPVIRERLGWLVYECVDYVTIVSDRDAGPPTLKGGDSRADGLVIPRSDIVRLEALQ